MLRKNDLTETPTMNYPSVDESSARLLLADWSIDETAFRSCHALVWIASGSNCENSIEGHGRSQAEAWYRATMHPSSRHAGSATSGAEPFSPDFSRLDSADVAGPKAQLAVVIDGTTLPLAEAAHSLFFLF